MKLQQIIENHWYKKKSNLILSIILFPFSIIFFIISKIRHLLYKFDIMPSYKSPVPIVIIGNISVGGVGKTPLTKHIAEELIKQNIQVGVILRGYKSKNKSPTIVTGKSNSIEVGDEALIYAQNNIPVAIGRDRYLAASELLIKHPNIQIVLSDDGLQHYKLKRDYEIVVVDATRLFGNKFVLPMGPLRENCGRLKSVNAIVINGSLENINDFAKDYKLGNDILIENQTLILKNIYNPITQKILYPQQLSNLKVCGISAVGNPERIFNFIISNGIKLDSKIPYPDHYHYEKKDIPDNFDVILVTEKDYTKLKVLNNDKIWVIQVDVALVPNKLVEQISALITS